MLQNRGACRDASAERRSLAALQRDTQGNVSEVLIRLALNLVSRMVHHLHAIMGVPEERSLRTSATVLGEGIVEMCKPLGRVRGPLS
jgi:hypothetical protein